MSARSRPNYTAGRSPVPTYSVQPQSLALRMRSWFFRAVEAAGGPKVEDIKQVMIESDRFPSWHCLNAAASARYFISQLSAISACSAVNHSGNGAGTKRTQTPRAKPVFPSPPAPLLRFTRYVSRATLHAPAPNKANSGDQSHQVLMSGQRRFQDDFLGIGDNIGKL